jgi:DNA-binding XRE family transcriptional regulator
MRMKTISSRIKKLKKQRKEKTKERQMEEAHKQSFLEAVRKFMGHMPMATKGCERSTYIKKQTELEDAHRQQIAAVVNEWDGTEKRYLQLKAKDPAAAEEKMKRTLEVFRQTLAALEKESKEEKNRLRAEHAECINTQISKEKRDAMIAYISAIQEEPVDADVILTSVRDFIQVCEHDRVHSLRHFEHVRNRNPEKADSLRGELLQHLKDLNKVVNESMSLLNYLPDIAQQFGLNGEIGGAILKPRLALPTEQEHTHMEAQHVLNNAEHRFNKHQNEEDDEDDIDDDDDDDDDIDDDDDDDDDNEIVDTPVVIGEKPVVKATATPIKKTKIPIEPEPVSTQVEKKIPVKTMDVEDHVQDREPDDIESVETFQRLDGDIKAIKSEIEASQRSPFAFTVIMGLSGGVLVIMLFIIIAMVMRRRRFNQSRVVITDNDDERDHLVEMQRNGFENPTYKFFYY